MGIFNLFEKKNKEAKLSSPMEGKCVSIKEVPDLVFSQETLGKGVAIIPTDGHVYAPADGTINMIFPTGHAVGMTTSNGAEILIHIGLDTVELNGEPFDIKIKNGQSVKKGDLLIVADIDQIVKSGKKIITPLVICNSNDYTIVEEQVNKNVKVGDELLKITG